MMTRRTLLQALDVPRIEAALRAAEARTSGEIRVSLSVFFWGSVEKAARQAFARLGMTATRGRNGVLFFVVPARRRLVVLGDEALHARVGQPFWEGVVERVTARFRTGDFTGGLVHGIEVVAEELARHFPHAGEADVNELPDEVDVGPPRGS